MVVPVVLKVVHLMTTWKFASMGCHEVSQKCQVVTATQEEKGKEKASIRYWKKKTSHEAMETGQEDVEQKTDKYMVFKTLGLLASEDCLFLMLGLACSFPIAALGVGSPRAVIQRQGMLRHKSLGEETGP
ncbi:hypothetical protein MC885_014813 [Smutsia gigantea]|nr:hypothetical protein MC885_014813 [Smutsia gigantea]